jgi:hypothetical protein
MDFDQLILQGTKVSPSKDFFIELYKKPEGDFTFCVRNSHGQLFYNPLDTDGEICKDDLLDWSKHHDLLFFSTNHLRSVFLFDLVHHQFYSEKLTSGQVALWDDDANRWLIRQKEYSIDGKDYYSSVGELCTVDYMRDVPEQKIMDIPGTDYSLWLQKHTIKIYDRYVWKIAIFSRSEYRLLVEDLGYYAVEDSVRITGNRYINFYGYKADSSTLCIITAKPRGQMDLFIWVCPPIVPMRMEWFSEENCWRAVINSTVIRPGPFYFDMYDTVRLELEHKSLPLKLMGLIVKEKPEFQDLYDQYLKEKREAQILQYEQQNTSAEDLIRRADSDTQIFQRIKARFVSSRRENPRTKALIYFILATVLLFAIPAAVAIAAYHGWQMNGVTMKNVATIMVLLGSFWISSLTFLLSFREKKHHGRRRKAIIVIIVLCIIALVIFGIVKASS